MNQCEKGIASLLALRPSDACCCRCSATRVQPSLNSYVLTDIDGERFYAVTLTIYLHYEVTSDETNDNDDIPRKSSS